MSTEKITDKILPIPDEHPAARAARLVKGLHEENIALIDSGHKFTKTHADGSIEDVSQKMRAASIEQMVLCDQIIARAPEMTVEHSEAAEALFNNISEETARIKQDIDKVKAEDALLPEVGNYEHGKTD